MASKPQPLPVSDTDVTHVVIELFGGDNNLSRYVLEDLQEMAAGNRGRFAVVALADFANEGGQIVELSPSKGLQIVEKVGEIDTGDPETLATFIARALVTYPKAAHRALGFWDHGSGVFDETDVNELILDRAIRAVAPRSKSRSYPARRLFIPKATIASNARVRAMLHDDTSGGVLTNVEAAGVLRAAFDRAGFKGKLDLIFSDTCLNGMIEVADELGPFANVVVGSEDLEPGDGWDYERLFRAMSDRPPATAAAWGSMAVEAFEAGYRDRPNQHPCTLAAFRTRNTITERFANLVKATRPLGRDGYRMLNDVRGQSQGFARRDTYDIRDFATRVASEATDDIKSAANGIVAAVDRGCIASAALGDEVRDARGLAFWFPSDKRAFGDTAGTYRKLAFDRASKWTDYLATFLA
jgi:hypothetical protein